MRAVIAPRGISRCSTSTAFTPPKDRVMWSATMIGSTFFTPGTGSPTWRPVALARGTGEVVGCSDPAAASSGLLFPVNGQILLVPEDVLRHEDHQHIQPDAHKHEVQPAPPDLP